VSPVFTGFLDDFWVHGPGKDIAFSLIIVILTVQWMPMSACLFAVSLARRSEGSELRFCAARPIQSVDLVRARLGFVLSLVAVMMLSLACLVTEHFVAAYLHGYIDQDVWHALSEKVVSAKTLMCVVGVLLAFVAVLGAANRLGAAVILSMAPGLVYWSATSGLYAALPAFLPDGATALDWSLVFAASVAVAGTVLEYVVALKRGLASYRGAAIAFGIWLIEIVAAMVFRCAGSLPEEVTAGRFLSLLGFLSLTVVWQTGLVNEINRRRHNQDGRSHFFW